MSFRPEIDGTYTIRTPGPEFLGRLKHRVAEGLLTGHPHPRSNYAVTESGAGGLQIRAADWVTAINVGLNEVHLQLAEAGVVQYRVRYWRWASFVLGLAGGLGLLGLVFLLFTDVHLYIERHSGSMIPGLSTDQNLVLVWIMVIFWGFLWPWLLIHLHQRPLRRLLERLLSETDGRGSSIAT